MSGQHRIDLQVLGGFAATRDGAPAIDVRQRDAKALLAYLALHTERPQPRSRVVAALWPDVPEPAARKRLRQALWHVRRALGRVVVGTERLALAPGLHVDAAAFEGALDRAADARAGEDASLETLERAVAIYAGPLLPGFDAEWIAEERDRLHARLLDALARLVEAHLQGGAFAAALRHARRWSEAEPLDEAAHRAVMRACALLGRRDEALHAYRRCREALARHLEAAPSEATEALHREIADAAAPPRSAAPSERRVPPPFVGRRGERAAILADLRSLSTGRGALLLVEGEAGIGKTRLLREASRDAAWRGIDAAWGTGYEASLRTAYGPLAHLARDLLTPLRIDRLARRVDPVVLRDLARWVPAVRDALPGAGGGPAHDPAPAVSLARAAAALARVRPLVLILDDLHWADAATAEALDALASALEDAPIMLSLSYRPDAARGNTALTAALERLERSAAARRLELGPLDAEEAETLVTRAVAEGPPDLEAVRRLHTRTGGNPLFLLDAAHALAAREAGDDGRTADGTSAPSTEVRARVAARLDNLPPLERRLARLVALADAPVAPVVLARAVGRPEDAVDAGVAALVARRLLVPLAGEVRIAHDVLRVAIVETLAAERRRRLHASLAGAIAELRPDAVERLAHHTTEAGAWSEAVAYHHRAARNAAHLQAFDSALHHYLQALELAERAKADAATRFELALGAEGALDASARRDEQAALLARMRELTGDDPWRMGDLARRQAWWATHTGRPDDAASNAQRALELAERTDDAWRRAAALHAWGAALDAHGHPREALEVLRPAVPLAEASGDARLAAAVHYAVGLAASGIARYREAPAAFERVLQLCLDTGDRVLEARAHNSRGALAMEHGRTREAGEAYTDALEAAQAVGHREVEAKVLANQGNLAYARGDLVRALALLDRSANAFARSGDRHKEAHVVTNASSMRAGFLGRLDEAERGLRDALEVFRAHGDPASEAHCLDNLGLVARQRGDLRAAEKLLAQGARLLEDAGDPWMAAFNHRSRALVHLDAGRTAGARRTAEAGAELAERAGLGDLAITLRALACFARAEAGDAAGAAERMDALMPAVADDALMAHVLHLWHARVLERAGLEDGAAAAIATAHALLEGALEPLTPDLRRDSLRHVPEHRAIDADFRRRHRVVRKARLARRSAAATRPDVRDHVEVQWTVWDPRDLHHRRGPPRRLHRLRRLLREAQEQDAEPTVLSLAEALGCSPSTVKRARAALRAAGAGSETQRDVPVRD